MAGISFHPVIQQWFSQRFGEPTAPQRLGWPHIAAGRHTLIAAPTGSGKTLAAFLVCLDRLWQEALTGTLDNSIHVVYVSPLKALSNDIERNLQVPLAEITRLAESLGVEPPAIRAAVRTGDTPASQRQAMLRRPPHILVTTPESLYILLTSQKSREFLRGVRTVIVDEIHALARDKRGSHLSLSLERLATLCAQPPVRIGLSATQRPIDEIARFLIGARGGVAERDLDDVTVVDVGHVRELDLALEAPATELSAVCSHEQWDEVYQRLGDLITAHRSTLVFVNTRRLAERVGHHLREMLGEEEVASHHGSLSREIRLSAEQRLKCGQLKAIVATASLEMGIDIGYIDLVCQIGSPRSIATFLQRVGRSGHSLGALPKGRLFPLTRDELLECMALVRAVRAGNLDQIEIPVAPLDILAQQIVASVACDEWNEDELYELCRRAAPYRDLTRADFDQIVHMLSEGITPHNGRGAYLHRDRIHHRLRARRGARLAAITSGGAIPDTAEYRVVTDPEGTFVGKVDEDFAIESMAGDVFLLGNTSWRVKYVRAGDVVVTDAGGAPPSIPFWLGEGPGRTVELSAEVSRLRANIASWQAGGQSSDEILSRLQAECGAGPRPAMQAAQYIAAQVAALGLVPTCQQIVFERFFDESGGMQLVIHAPLGQRINRAWGMALRKRFCRSFDFELQAAATDNGVLLSLSPQHSFPIDALFQMLGPHNGQHLLEQALLAQPMFQVRWRWNITRSLAVPRQQNGKRIPPHMLRFRSDDLLASVFPETVGCLENHHGDVNIPDHPLVRQTMRDCLGEAMDVRRWLALLADIRAHQVDLIARDTREPSPFCHEILNANPYAFLDGAPLEERRTRAVSARRTFTAEEIRELARLDPDAIAQVRADAWPVVRDTEELHDVLLRLVALDESEAAPWRAWSSELIQSGRATIVDVGDTSSAGPPVAKRPGADSSGLTFSSAFPSTGDTGAAETGGAETGGAGECRELVSEQGARRLLIAAERWPVMRALFPHAVMRPPVQLPADLDVAVEQTQALVEFVRGQMSVRGPTTAACLAGEMGLAESQVHAALESIESHGGVLRGEFSPLGAVSGAADKSASGAGGEAAGRAVQWCDRRLLARIHRVTLDGLRERIKPVTPSDFHRFLARHHRLTAEVSWAGPAGLREVVGLLQGFEAPAGAWEKQLLAGRVADYDPQWLDHLFLAGEVVWGRLRPPRRQEGAALSMAALTRVVPISLLLREDLPWLAEGSHEPVDGFLRGHSQQVLEALANRGALFFQELKHAVQLLPGHLEEALRELAACGLITCDGYAAVRSFVAERPGGSRRRGRSQAVQGAASPSGRWSRFPGDSGAPPAANERLDRWCRQLLRRYGVVFRDVLVRESCSPGWHELAPVLRRMELRGEVRGGRFVSGVGGEQFAAENVVERLRETRDSGGESEWLLLSAADPLNLSGIVGEGPRIAATHRNLLVVHQGRCVAARQAGQIAFFESVDTSTRAEMQRALQTGRRHFASHVREEWLKQVGPVSRPRSLVDSPSEFMR